MPTSIRNDRPLYEIPMGLADMFAATGRGITRGTLGLPGDLESLVRMGIGGEQKLPTSEDWNKKLPPLEPMIKHPNDIHPYDQLGMFYNLPIYGGTASLMGKGVSKGIKKLGSGIHSESRRDFIKKGAALTAGAAGITKVADWVHDASKAIPPPEVTKIADEPIKAVAKTHKFNSLKEYNEYLNEEVAKELEHLDLYGYNRYPNKFNIKSKLATKDEDLYRVAKDERDLWNYPEYGGSKLSPEEVKETLNAFSPQAKAEMKQFKDDYMDTGYREHDKWNMLDSYLK